MHATPSSPRPRVVVVGAGFAGLEATKVLAGAPVEVTLIDRNNYHKFQPLLYQVATAGLEPDEIVHPVRDILGRRRNVRFLMGTVARVDRARREVVLAEGTAVPYDHLILAAGATTSYFGIPGAAEHAFPMKTVPEALHLRNHILRRFEHAERDDAPEGALTFVVVGGGPTGVELAGQLAELFQRVLRKDYRHVDTARARVVLVEMLPELLASYAPSLRAYTRRALEGRGVEVRTGTRVARVTPEAVVLEGGERIPTQTLIWAAGVKASPLADAVGTPQAGGGRLQVAPDLSLPGHPEVFAVGDLCGATDADGEAYPQLATVAVQQGRHAARQVLRRARGQATQPFRYTDPGTMATIGRSDAVAQLAGGVRLKGFVAWLMWAFLHIFKLVGFRNRVDVFLNWVYNYATYDFNARIIMDVVPQHTELPPEGPAGSADGQAARSEPASA